MQNQNLSKRTVQLPKYLIKYKIKNISRKIIVRKYAYIWFKKVISDTLPSVAKKYQVHMLKRRVFNVWKGHWFDKRRYWKLELRATLHYSMLLKHKSINRWLYFVIHKKELRLKMQIARVHYNRKIKSRYFLRLVYRSEIMSKMEECARKFKEYLAYLYLNRQVLLFLIQYYKMLRNYHYKALFEKSYARRIKQKYLKKWYSVAKLAAWEHQANSTAREFYKSHYRIKYLEVYFKIWKCFVYESKIKRQNYSTAENHLRMKLLYNSFTKLQNYYQYREKKRILKDKSDFCYKTRLKKQVIANWMNYVNEKCQKRSKKEVALGHYKKQIKKKYFFKLLEYKDQQQNLRHKLDTFSIIQEGRLKKNCFRKLQVYCRYKVCKRQKYQLCERYCKFKLLNVYLRRLRKFVTDKQFRKTKNQQLITISLELTNLRISKRCFNNWKYYTRNRLKQKSEIVKCHAYYQNHLIRKAFSKWSAWIQHRKQLKSVVERWKIFYNDYLIHKVLIALWTYTKYEKQLKIDLECAKIFHDKLLIRKGISVILKGGLKNKEQNQRKIMANFEKKLRLTYKFFHLWKQKALKNKPPQLYTKSHLNEILSNCYSRGRHDNKHNPASESFKWNPLCFMKPRIPNYMAAFPTQ